MCRAFGATHIKLADGDLAFGIFEESWRVLHYSVICLQVSVFCCSFLYVWMFEGCTLMQGTSKNWHLSCSYFHSFQSVQRKFVYQSWQHLWDAYQKNRKIRLVFSTCVGLEHEFLDLSMWIGGYWSDCRSDYWSGSLVSYEFWGVFLLIFAVMEATVFWSCNVTCRVSFCVKSALFCCSFLYSSIHKVNSIFCDVHWSAVWKVFLVWRTWWGTEAGVYYLLNFGM